MLPAAMIGNLSETINLVTTQTQCEWWFLQIYIIPSNPNMQKKCRITDLDNHFRLWEIQLHTQATP